MSHIYLASPGSPLQAEAVKGQRVLISFETYWKGVDRFIPAFNSLLIDSGAFSVMNSKRRVDVSEYVEWVSRFEEHCDAWAGLDDIEGNWRKSLRNYERGGFPTFHDTDPEELLDDLLEISKERGMWIGVGLKPPRQGKSRWIERTLSRIPDEFHVHGWACRIYSKHRRFDTFDTTGWWSDMIVLRQDHRLSWLTDGELLDIAVKKYVRENRLLVGVDTTKRDGFFSSKGQ